jgi:hypothetical protein
MKIVLPNGFSKKSINSVELGSESFETRTVLQIVVVMLSSSQLFPKVAQIYDREAFKIIVGLNLSSLQRRVLLIDLFF